jgi:hypothetical protein
MMVLVPTAFLVGYFSCTYEVLPAIVSTESGGIAIANLTREAKAPRSFDPDFELARQESFGFFEDVSSSDWAKLKEKFRAMSPNFNTLYLPPVDSEAQPASSGNKPGQFYQNHYEPDFVCQYERRIGKLGDGGKWICDPHRIAEQKDCLVYSVGSNNDFSFEEGVLRDIGPHCEIHTFDFGDFAAGAERLGTRLHDGVNKTAVVYHQFGVGRDDPPKFKSLKTIVEELGHVNRTVDIFKIDCEGEYACSFVQYFNSVATWELGSCDNVIRNVCDAKSRQAVFQKDIMSQYCFLVASDLFLRSWCDKGCEWNTSPHWFEAPVFLRQIQVELHRSDVRTTPQFFDRLYEQNYVITHKEANVQWTGPFNLAIEYAFLKMDSSFNDGFERPKGAAMRPKET